MDVSPNDSQIQGWVGLGWVGLLAISERGVPYAGRKKVGANAVDRWPGAPFVTVRTTCRAYGMCIPYLCVCVSVL